MSAALHYWLCVGVRVGVFRAASEAVPAAAAAARPPAQAALAPAEAGDATHVVRHRLVPHPLLLPVPARPGRAPLRPRLPRRPRLRLQTRHRHPLQGQSTTLTSVEQLLLVSQFQQSQKILATYAIVTVFFSRPSNENFTFLKNCPYDFHNIFHRLSKTKAAPACAMASKSYDWDLRDIGKISPKMSE